MSQNANQATELEIGEAMAKKRSKATKETDDTDARGLSSEKTQTINSESASAGAQPELDELQAISSGTTRSTYDSSQLGVAMNQGVATAPEWKVNPFHNTTVSQSQQVNPSFSFPPGSFLDTRVTANETSGRGTGFASRSLAGSDVAMAPEIDQILRAQQSVHRDAGVAHSSVAGSSQQSSLPSGQQDAYRQQLQLQHYQQQQLPTIDPRLLATMYLHPQGSTFSLAPPMDDYQAALFQVASSPFLRGFPRNDTSIQTGYLGSASIGSLLPPTFRGMTTFANAPSAAQYASLLRGRNGGQRAEVSVTREERGNRPAGTHPAMTGVTRGLLEPFPERLHRLLSEVEAAGLSDVVSFTEDGNAFQIHKPEDFFRKIVQVYFKQSRLSSFKRQLNLYGFELIDHGRSKGAYYHSLFVRNRPDLARQIRRTNNRSASRDSKKQDRTSSKTAPDFYNMPPVLSSAEAEQKQAASKSSGEEAKAATPEADSSSSRNSKSEGEKKKRATHREDPDS